MMTRNASPLRRRASATNSKSSSASRSRDRVASGACIGTSSWTDGGGDLGLAPRQAETAAIYCGEELLARFGALAKGAEHAARHHCCPGLADAATGHASMGTFDHHGDTLRGKHPVQGVGDLRRHLLLDLQPPGIDLNETRKLGYPDHFLARQVADVCATRDWGHVVLTMRHEPDVAQHHHFVVPRDLLERARQMLAGILAVAGKPFLIGTHDAGRRIEQSFAVGVIAGPQDERANGFLRLGP